MLAGTYEARSLDTSVTATVRLDGRPGGRIVRERVAACIAAYWAGHGYAPSLRDVAAGLGLAVSTVHHHVLLLERAGMLESTPGLMRSLRVVKP